MKKGSINPHLYKARVGYCELCGKEYRAVKDYGNKKQRWCSKECWSNRASVVNKCLYCGKEIRSFKSVSKKYCGLECRNLDYRNRLKGANSHFWKGGKTKQSKIEKTSSEYREWRNAVFIRDNYRCVICGKNDKSLEADHIKPQSKHPELRYVISNGRTLCHSCHKDTDTYGSKCNRWCEFTGKYDIVRNGEKVNWKELQNGKQG